MSSPRRWLEATVRQARGVTPTVRMIEIVPAEGVVAYRPGSHLEIAVMIGERPDIRTYSLVGPPSDGAYRIAVRQVAHSRGGSRYMWSLEPGARLRIAGPLNCFELSFGRPEYLLIAGGIGITPIYGMALELARRGARFRLLHAIRSRADLPLDQGLEGPLGERLGILVSEEGRRLDLEAEIARLDPDGELCLCGPIGMLEEARRIWRMAGRPPSRLRFETFGSSGRFAPEPFTVRVLPLEVTLTVPADRSMLDALIAAGVDVMYDCLRGECGLCAVDIVALDGQVDHRDVFLSDAQKAESRKICTCVSRIVGGGVAIDSGYRAA